MHYTYKSNYLQNLLRLLEILQRTLINNIEHV